ncbi:energy-coupling factor ABC transporter permease [Puniceicoccaceae bacterium K14]|nr:energy-coupling factor ABC transporter permease [Puniceicoccaceae bacterium K14]
MHLPNEYISDATCIATAAISATAITWATSSTLKTKMKENSALALGVATSLVFVAQMLNYPIMNGVSGHLIGGALLGALFGPARAILAMVSITLFQALLLGDGGLAAIGANSINLAIIPALLGAGGARLCQCIEFKAVAIASAAVIATFLGAISASVMISTSSNATLSESLHAMAYSHLIAGLYEGGLTLVAYALVQRFIKVSELETIR